MREKRFLALGDSYTIGAGVEASDRWPNQLVALLRDKGVRIGDPEIIAQTGWTTDNLAEALSVGDQLGPYDLVSLLIGVNNQFQGREVGDYRVTFTALMNNAIDLAGGNPGRVIVLSIPDWGVTPFANGRDRARISAEIDAYNAANREVSEALGAHYIDITDISREAGADASMLVEDELHPSGDMYRKWAALVLPAACEAFGEE